MKNNSRSANDVLEELLGYGKYQKFQVWIFLGLVSFLGAVDYFHAQFLIMKQTQRCSFSDEIELK